MIKAALGGGTHYSAEQKALQNKMMGMAEQNLGKGMAPYPGALGPGIDPMKMMAANIMMGMQGKTYQAPPMMTYPEAWTQQPTTPTKKKGGGGKAKPKGGYDEERRRERIERRKREGKRGPRQGQS